MHPNPFVMGISLISCLFTLKIFSMSLMINFSPFDLSTRKALLRSYILRIPKFPKERKNLRREAS